MKGAVFGHGFVYSIQSIEYSTLYFRCQGSNVCVWLCIQYTVQVQH